MQNLSTLYKSRPWLRVPILAGYNRPTLAGYYMSLNKFDAFYSLTSNKKHVDEGTDITFNLKTINIENGSKVFYTIEGCDSADFVDNLLSGECTIINSYATFTKSVKKDTLTEGTEDFIIKLNINTPTGRLVKRTPIFTIDDVVDRSMYNNLVCSTVSSFCINGSGELYAAGENSYGELGVGDSSDKNIPTKVNGVSNVKDVAVGFQFTLCLTVSGQVYTWGRNNYGQLGVGDTPATSNVPLLVSSLSNVVEIGATQYNGFAITEDGSIYGWGLNNTYMLGLNNTTMYKTPVFIIQDPLFKKIVGGDRNVFAIRTDGQVYVWGAGYLGANGVGSPQKIPMLSPDLVNIDDISAGLLHVLALKKDGHVMACGENYYGSLGIGTQVDSEVFVNVSSLSDIVEICAGKDQCSFAINSDGDLYSWGYGQISQTFRTSNASTPTIVSEFNGIKDVACGGHQTLVITSDNLVYGIGANNLGQLGIGSNSNALVSTVSQFSVL